MGFDAETVARARRCVSIGWTEPWLNWLDAAIRREIARLRARYQLSLDEFRGLYVSDEQVDRLAANSHPADESCEPLGAVPWTPCLRSGPEVDSRTAQSESGSGKALSGGGFATNPLRHTAEVFGLTPQEAAAIFVALAPEFDSKYDTLFAYLQDDVTRKAPTIDLIVRLTGEPVAAFQESGRLFGQGLLTAKRSDQDSRRSATVRVSGPLREFLLRADSSDNSDGRRPISDTPLATPQTLRAVPLLVLEATPGADPLETALAVAPDLAKLEEADDDRCLDDFLLGVRLRRQTAYFSPSAFRLDRDDPPTDGAKRLLKRALGSPVPKIVAAASRSPWRQLLEGCDFDMIRIEPPDRQTRAMLWREALPDAIPEDVEEVAGLFALHPNQIRHASARAKRGAEGNPTFKDLSEAARAQCSSDLGALAAKEPEAAGWQQLILPPTTAGRLKEFEAAIRNRTRVFGDWSFEKTSGGSHSLKALFTGSSGTGKTLSASVIATELGLDLYRIDLSAVVSKYIGETESNLERVFRAAEGSNAILFFDEADALFGKRTEVKDAHDRFANIEIAYLLQRMERYDGVLILATNIGQNVDEAFSRRIHYAIDFPMPDERDRAKLWDLLIPPQAPRAEDVDLNFLARQFPIAGGDIRNVALHAAFLAASEDRSISMRHLIRAMARQRVKHGKAPSSSEFKQYYELIQEPL